MSEEYVMNMIYQNIAVIGGAIALGIHYTEKINNFSFAEKYNKLERKVKKFSPEEMDEINIL